MPMRPAAERILIACNVVWTVVLAMAAFLVVGVGGVVPVAFLVGYGMCLAYAGLYYRQVRQEEFQHLLLTAVEAEVPLGRALLEYCRDRPKGLRWQIDLAAILVFLLPGSYWVISRRRSFDRQIGLVGGKLQLGLPLPEALEEVPGVAAPETLAAVSIGQDTGRMAECLRGAAAGRLSTLWLEILSRVLYPLVLLVLVLLHGALARYIYSKVMADFAEMKQPVTGFSAGLFDYWGLIFGAAGVFLAVAITGLIVWACDYPIARWNFPPGSWLYRLNIRGRVLQMLAMLLQAGKPVPQALQLLAGSSYFTPAVQQKLLKACRQVEQGKPLADSLQGSGLLTAALAPLVQSAQRMQNLPWALGALGEAMIDRSVRRARQVSQVVCPILVLLIGVLAGAIAIGLLLPLIDTITSLSTW